MLPASDSQLQNYSDFAAHPVVSYRPRAASGLGLSSIFNTEPSWPNLVIYLWQAYFHFPTCARMCIIRVGTLPVWGICRRVTFALSKHFSRKITVYYTLTHVCVSHSPTEEYIYRKHVAAQNWQNPKARPREECIHSC